MLKKSKRNGFTLVELIVVLAMIGFLASITLTGLNNSRQRSRDTIRAGDLKSLSQAAETYFSEEFVFPDSLSELAKYYSDNVLPTDPSPDRSYMYEKGLNSKTYCLGAMMETEEQQNTVVCGLEVNGGINYQVQGP
ncbi:MAG: type II secretion system protein [Candidatus Paceibacterota bacterium]|jgi:prepilin-type N-terminal cleavage/methylation domain-containing protein